MIYTIICSRENKEPSGFKRLLDYFNRADIKTKVIYDAKSIFEAYSNGVKELDANPEDIIIFCHDDIEILSETFAFKDILYRTLSNKRVGFVGLAGTTHLGKDAVWWDYKRRLQGLHRGFVFQGKDTVTMTPNFFGTHGNVVALDGCFLAARKEVLDQIGIDRPESFKGYWDFYDILYTVRAYESGFFNLTVPIIALHNSSGELAGRDSWYLNKTEFVKMFRLPISCK